MMDWKLSGPESSDRLSRITENLNESEQWWMERSEFLESSGYRLRPRFRRGWVPSWQNTGRNPLDFEDARFHMVEDVMDATRLSDGRQVVLKAVRRNGNEVRIAMMLSSEESMRDPMNHCVPILDYFGDLTTRGPDFMVMPLLHRFNVPDFFSVSELLDFVRQTLEGLIYLHRRHVAHRDLSSSNIMIDASEMFPDGVHPDPLWCDLHPDHLVPARFLRRTQLKKVTYYFIDFGISSHFEDPREPRLVTGIDGRDREVPERHLTEPYDPFPVDVFSLGNTYKRLFRNYRDLEFLSPLIEEMTKRNPQERPAAEVALALFHDLTAQLGDSIMNKRLRSVNEPIVVHYIHELSSSWKAFLGVMEQIFCECFL
ncbi:hypothetical protein ACEPAF_229 [Sanghuangporus sanghuang]